MRKNLELTIIYTKKIPGKGIEPTPSAKLSNHSAKQPLEREIEIAFLTLNAGATVPLYTQVHITSSALRRRAQPQKSAAGFY